MWLPAECPDGISNNNVYVWVTDGSGQDGGRGVLDDNVDGASKGKLLCMYSSKYRFLSNK